MTMSLAFRRRTWGLSFFAWALGLAVLPGQEYGLQKSQDFLLLGSVPYLSPLADLDLDGSVDFAAHRYAFFGRGDGTFVQGPLAQDPMAVMAITDMNGDEIPDLLALSPWLTGPLFPPDEASPEVRIGLGAGDGSFDFTEVALPCEIGGRVLHANAADLDNDGFTDILLQVDGTNPSTGGKALVVVHGSSSGEFLDCRAFAPVDPDAEGELIGFPVLRDLDGDGRLDIVAPVVNDTQKGWVSVLIHQGGRDFERPRSYLTLPPDLLNADGNVEFWEPRPTDMVAMDLDGDGDLDLVVGHRKVYAISVLENHGDGSFATGIPFRLLERQTPQTLTAADVNGDGDLDTLTLGSTRMDLYFNFLRAASPVHKTPLDRGPEGEAITQLRMGDLNGDSVQDVIVNGRGCDLSPDPCSIVAFLGHHGNVFLRGNAEEDGAVDISDAIRTLEFLFQGGPPLVCEDSADANDDGTTDLSDPVYTLNYLFLGGKAMPAPFPDPGPDPTLDALGCRE